MNNVPVSDAEPKKVAVSFLRGFVAQLIHSTVALWPMGLRARLLLQRLLCALQGLTSGSERKVKPCFFVFKWCKSQLIKVWRHDGKPMCRGRIHCSLLITKHLELSCEPQSQKCIRRKSWQRNLIVLTTFCLISYPNYRHRVSCLHCLRNQVAAESQQ